MSETYNTSSSLDGAITAEATELVLADAFSPAPLLPARARIAGEEDNGSETILLTAVDVDGVTYTIQRNYAPDPTAPAASAHGDGAYVAIASIRSGVAPTVQGVVYNPATGDLYSGGTPISVAGDITDVLDLPTSETDTAKVLAPNGSGGLEFRAGGSAIVTIVQAVSQQIRGAINVPFVLPLGAPTPGNKLVLLYGQRDGVDAMPSVVGFSGVAYGKNTSRTRASLLYRDVVEGDGASYTFDNGNVDGRVVLAEVSGLAPGDPPVFDDPDGTGTALCPDLVVASAGLIIGTFAAETSAPLATFWTNLGGGAVYEDVDPYLIPFSRVVAAGTYNPGTSTTVTAWGCAVAFWPVGA